MGQRIVLRDSTIIGDVAIFDTDRTISGQDGESFTSLAAAREGISFSARLATRIFEADDAVDSVFVQSNAVTVRRAGGWDGAAGVGAVIEGFFEFYA